MRLPWDFDSQCHFTVSCGVIREPGVGMKAQESRREAARGRQDAEHSHCFQGFAFIVCLG